jgi:hypothetical protein
MRNVIYLEESQSRPSEKRLNNIVITKEQIHGWKSYSFEEK